MKNIVTRILFMLTGLSLYAAIYYWIFYPNTSVDIQMHDNYFVFAISHFWIMLSLIFALNGGIYWVLNKTFKRKLNIFLGLIHLLMITGGILFLISAINFTGLGITDYFQNANHLKLSLLLIILAHIFIPINIVFTLLKKQK